MTRLYRMMGVAAGIGVMLAIVACGNNTPGTPEPPVLTPDPANPGEADSGPNVGNPQPEIVATVNGVPIEMDTFRRELARFEAGQVALGFQVADRAGYEQQVLDLLIEQELIRQLGASQGVVVTDEEVDTVINELITENGADYFNGWLAGNLYTIDEFREVIRQDLLTNRVVQPVVDSVPSATQHVHARHILTNTQQSADEALARLLAGEDFAALSAEYSVDVTTKNNGGDLGWFPRGGLLVPEVEDVAFGMQPGETSAVFETAWGFHIVQTLEFVDNREVEFETHQLLLEQTIETWRLGLREGEDVQQLVDLTAES